MVGGALAGIPTVVFAFCHSLTAQASPLLALASVLVGASIGSWVGGVSGAFVAALLSIPAAGAIQVIARNCGGPALGASRRRGRGRQRQASVRSTLIAGQPALMSGGNNAGGSLRAALSPQLWLAWGRWRSPTAQRTSPAHSPITPAVWE